MHGTGNMMMVECVGCGNKFQTEAGMLCYTCPCGATILMLNNNLAPPASLITGIVEGKELPHLDYYLGLSKHSTPAKEQLIKELRQLGCVWSWECPTCRERFLKRHKMLIDEGLQKTDWMRPDLVTIIKDFTPETTVPE